MRKTTAKSTIAALLGLAVVLGLAASMAEAHNAGLFAQRYPVDPNLHRVEVRFDRSVPGGATRDRIQNGAHRWSRERRQLIFDVSRAGYRGRGVEQCEPPNNNGNPRGVIYWHPIDGPGGSNRDVLGFNSNCRYRNGAHRGRLAGFRQVYDSEQPNWYRRTGDAPDERVDLWSVASHEFGHAAGWTGRHYGRDEDPSRSVICNPDNVNRQTMCSIIYLGSESVRTLGRHDRHTFRRVYAAR